MVCAIVLAGGKGERMNSELPKVLHKIADRPLIFWALDLLKKIDIENVVVVTGYQANKVEEETRNAGYKVSFARQEEPLGTGHAVSEGLKKAPPGCNTILVLFGDDSALYKPETITNFIEAHLENGSPMTILTAIEDSPTPIGGLEKDSEGNVIAVLAQSQLVKRGMEKNEIACGAFCFDRSWLEQNLPLLEKSPLSGEYPLPGLIYIAASQKLFAKTFPISDRQEWSAVNTIEELEMADVLKREWLSKQPAYGS